MPANVLSRRTTWYGVPSLRMAWIAAPSQPKNSGVLLQRSLTSDQPALCRMPLALPFVCPPQSHSMAGEAARQARMSALISSSSPGMSNALAAPSQPW